VSPGMDVLKIDVEFSAEEWDELVERLSGLPGRIEVVSHTSSDRRRVLPRWGWVSQWGLMANRERLAGGTGIAWTAAESGAILIVPKWAVWPVGLGLELVQTFLSGAYRREPWERNVGEPKMPGWLWRRVWWFGWRPGRL
jgi:hypothetical protein